MPMTDERGNTVLSARDMAILYMPEIPGIEAERDKLRIQNAAFIKQIQELKFNLSNSDKTPDYIKCTNIVKSNSASIINAKENEIREKEKAIREKEKEIKNREKIIAIRENTIQTLEKLTTFEDKIYALEAKNAELLKSIQADKEKSNLEKSSTQQISEFSKKTLQEKKDLELRCSKFSKQISTLQDLLEKERQIFKENKKSYELEKKNAEKRNTGIFKEISEKSKNMEKNFEQERSHFESEISTLASKLTALPSDYQKEQKANSDLKQKFDTLSDERNFLTKKINDLEAANIELSDKVTAEIRPSNLFYDKSVDGPASFYVKSLGKQSKKNQMVWRVKDYSEEKKKGKASASTTNAKKNKTHKGLLKRRYDVLTVEHMTLVIKFIISEFEKIQTSNDSFSRLVDYSKMLNVNDFSRFVNNFRKSFKVQSHNEVDNEKTATMCFIGDDDSDDDEDSSTDEYEANTHEVPNSASLCHPLVEQTDSLRQQLVAQNRNLKKSTRHIWRVKQKSDDSVTVEDKCVDDLCHSDSFAVCNKISKYSIKQMIRITKDVSYSSSGSSSDDYASSSTVEYVHYSDNFSHTLFVKTNKFTHIRTTTNKYGPKYKWVPKPKTAFELQAPNVKGE
ncbi:hypothetical protein L6452_02067 [Arctium lappa]|uniref:Uncharacterized protein n=1 Tax=Arctium lappa TaxID=4217 RepID=A0ACB9FHU0_ARCLA|nr:hypothetical protein L6452_02067 [Arctium lappa]